MILLTGASGFIGSSLLKKLKHNVRCVLRTDSNFNVPGVEVFYVDSISGATNWTGAFDKIDIVVHLAGRAHILHDSSKFELNRFKSINTEGTLRLAKHAVQNGVKRFIFLSSIGVNGNMSEEPFTELDPPCPSEPYAISKLEAEEELRCISEVTGLEVVIIRSPLVYGPKAPGNFGRLLHLVSYGIPLPFKGVQNKRSFISVNNLTDFIILCSTHPKAANETFLIADGEDISTPDLIKYLAFATKKPCCLFYFPRPLILFLAKIFRKKSAIEKLFISLQVDCSKAKKLLGWNPRYSIRNELFNMAESGEYEKT